MIKKEYFLLAIILLFLAVSCKINYNDSYRFTVWNVGFRLTEDKEERAINDNVLYKYLDNYGIIKDLFKVEFLGYDSGVSIRGVHGWLGRDWIRAYEIRAPFMEKPFEVWIDNRTHEIFGDNFYEVLSTDAKFQHLYSDWVKKQIGCEDENVELEFSCGGISFLRIEHLSKDLSEIFKNARMHCKDVRVYNLKKLNFENSFEYALDYKKNIADKVFEVTGIPEGGMTIWIHLYSSDEYSGEQYYFKYKSDNPSELLRSKV